MAKKLTCVVTGKTTSVSDEQYNKRVQEHGSEQLMLQRHVSKQARSLLTRGYDVAETRNMLNVEVSLPDVPPEVLQWMINRAPAAATLNHQTSDVRVVEYINSIKNRRN